MSREARRFQILQYAHAFEEFERADILAATALACDSHVHTLMAEMIEAGEIEVLERGRGHNPGRYRLGAVGRERLIVHWAQVIEGLAA